MCSTCNSLKQDQYDRNNIAYKYICDRGIICLSKVWYGEFAIRFRSFELYIVTRVNRL